MTDQTAQDDEYDPSITPKSSRAWLAIIKNAEREFADYQTRSDRIDDLYANLGKLAASTRDRQFQLFWANVQVLGPSIYSRPPVPVVVPRFKDRRPIPRTASELLERATTVAFEMEDIDGTMIQARDDLTVVGRGALWVRYETKAESDGDSERVCIEHVDRKDFLHDPAREWREVDWVAKRSWLTKAEMRKRFRRSSGDAYLDASFAVRKDDEGADDRKPKAQVWEIWSKSQNRVVWVSEGCDKLLDDGAPHLKLEGFFPCPRPAYSTVQRRSLIPVPDMVYYRDQLEEINDITARMASIADALKVRGFYPAGAGEISDAIEGAIKSNDDRAVMIPVSNWAMMGGGAAKDMIVWLPIGDIAKVVVQLIELRKQLIEDVYQIMGLSDIMRGSTEASETLGAQQLKSQYGSVRIRDKQSELVRIARDVTRIVAEIMAENFASKTLLDMSQLELPKRSEINSQVKAIEGQARAIQTQVAQAQADPRVQAMMQQEPEQAQQLIQQAQEQLSQLGGQAAKLKETTTIDDVMDMLRDQRIRPFTLDIETDSTIAPDENAQKQRATEFVTAVGGFMAQAVPLVQQLPQAAPLAAETLKYVAGQYRAGRQLEQVIDEFADSMKALSSQPKPPDPAQLKAEQDAKAAEAKAQTDQIAAQAEATRAASEAKAMEAEAQAKLMQAQQEIEAKQAEEAHKAELRRQDIAAKAAESALKRQHMEDEAARSALKHGQEMELGALNLEKARLEINRVQVQTDNSIAATEAGIAAKAAAAASKPQPGASA